MRRWRAAGLGVALVLGVAGCGLGDLQKRPDSDRCGWMQQESEAPGATVILVDVSNSTRGAITRAGSTGGSAPHYGAALEKAIEDAVGRRDTVSVASFSGTAANLGWVVTDRSTDWKKDVNNDPNQQSRRAEGVRCLLADADPVLGARPLGAGSDILQAVGIGAGRLREGGGDKHLVVLSDGLPTTGCADLTKLDQWTDAQVTGIVDRCVRKKTLRPGDLAGVDVSLIGVGHSGTGYPIADSQRRDWLKRLWTALCERAGTARRCGVDTQPIAAEDDDPPPSPDAAVDDVVVPLAGKVTVRPLLGAALFDGDSAVLRSAGERALRELAESIRTADWVEVIGYAAPYGSAPDLLRLSRARAERVGSFLAELGVPVVAVRGAGATRSCPDPVLESQVGADECFRRVDVVVGNS
ncbi:OmpA family protein [Cryptosporangium aurantiacum]|uniref:Outer membrane protein OmpA n=1 Tax=Cryptosporangium aurantiacum TaxID=134849 RepID=A0A1M7K3Y6_9ACTN|nr:OmpA family protein [Cryptosporangium aurantiacum]SHM59527.1 Outer membrane protein OmpA [Cryptosporangium aurantiacum]